MADAHKVASKRVNNAEVRRPARAGEEPHPPKLVTVVGTERGMAAV